MINSNLTTLPQSPVEEDTGKPSDIALAFRAMEDMAVIVDSPEGPEKYYKAALPAYPGDFTRDGTLANQLSGNAEGLNSQVAYSARRLGTKADPVTGEEPGKPFHQLPGVTLHHGLSTEFNACDTAALLLHSIAALTEKVDHTFLDKYVGVIDANVGYIKRHVNSDGLFVEDPAFAGNTNPDGRVRRFALKVTYWKDSELNRADRRAPHYPIVYSVAHFQNASALSRIGKLRGDERLARQGRYMMEAGLAKLWAGDHFITAADQDGVIDPPSSDSLYSLLYLDPTVLPSGKAKAVEKYMAQLETEAGYRSGIPVAPDIDPYHMHIWTHEQAVLNAAAQKHSLTRAEDITRRIEPFIIPADDLYPELVDPDIYNPSGNMQQLWSMGAFIYFRQPDAALF